jgi:hypothetical protein
MMKTIEDSRELAAQAWCEPETEHIVMIPELAEAFAKIIDRVRLEQHRDTREACADSLDSCSMMDDNWIHIDAAYSAIMNTKP